MMSDGIMKSFHDPRNEKMPIVAAMGASSGQTTLR